jgi:hypothetical protein
MADSKITALTALTAADPANDMMPIVDVSDTSMAASGTTKRISINNILACSPTATLASATITGAATVGTTLGVTGVSTFAAGTVSLPALTTTGDTNTGIYYPAADTFAVTTGGTERYRVDSTGLGIGVAPNLGLNVLKTSDTSFTNLPINVGFADSTAMAAGVGGGISFSGRFDGTSSTTAYGIISGVKENGTASNFAGALVFGTRDAGGNTNIERLRINSTGNIVMKTAGTGIDFSATTEGSGTMTSELLNDYEEGTFTPTLQFSGLSVGVTYSNRTGIYTKVGRIVHFSGRIDLSSKGTSVGDATIAGLPFAANTGAASVGFQSSVAPSDKQAILTIDTSSLIVRYASGTTTAASTDTNFSNSSILIFAGTYAV